MNEDQIFLVLLQFENILMVILALISYFSEVFIYLNVYTHKLFIINLENSSKFLNREKSYCAGMFLETKDF